MRHWRPRRVAPPRADDPGYIPFLTDLVNEHGVSAVVPLTDLDLEILARGDLPAFVPDPEVCAATFDKYRAEMDAVIQAAKRR